MKNITLVFVIAIVMSFLNASAQNDTCLGPSNFSATNSTSSSVTLNWDPVAGAEGYKIRYKVATTTVWTKILTLNNSKTINGLSPNTHYKWEVKSYCHIGAPSVSSIWSLPWDFYTTLRVAEEQSPIPSFQLYPNPAADHVTMQFTLAQSSHISIRVFDGSGKQLATVLNDDVGQGKRILELDIKDFSAGIYFVKMISDLGTETQKMMVQ